MKTIMQNYYTTPKVLSWELITDLVSVDSQEEQLSYILRQEQIDLITLTIAASTSITILPNHIYMAIGGYLG